jgi:hypothetical protein
MQGLVSKAAVLGGIALFALLLGGCGDDDGGDAGTGDAATDGGGDDDDLRPRRDGSMGSDPVPECDRFDPLACGAGQRCQLVIRRAAGEMQFLIYPGCVEESGARSEGTSCDPWGGLFLPYRAEGLVDELYADPCEQGLYCAPDSAVRGFTCQRSCQSGFYEGFGQVSCPADAYCIGPEGAPFEEACVSGDRCDPTDRNGCAPGFGCYLRLNDTATGALSVCLPTLDPPLADGEVCQTYRDCRAGSSCWGSARVPPTQWVQADLRCRRSCTVGEPLPDVDIDAGADDGEDGGASAASCNECVPFDESGVDPAAVSATLGQCE